MPFKICLTKDAIKVTDKIGINFPIHLHVLELYGTVWKNLGDVILDSVLAGLCLPYDCYLDKIQIVVKDWLLV